jgi:hypothetical protein
MEKLRNWLRPGPFVSVLRLEGVIGAGARFGAPALTDTGLAPLVEAAFKRGKPKAVALLVNSPGGSPAQSSLIAARIRRLADEKGVPVFAFCEDVAASGGYWLATAADEIWVDGNSILGSIGVISASFGFHELLAKNGVERRVHTAGEDKSLLDPFRPERAEDVARLKRLQAAIHANFIEQVKARRGAAERRGSLHRRDLGRRGRGGDRPRGRGRPSGAEDEGAVRQGRAVPDAGAAQAVPAPLRAAGNRGADRRGWRRDRGARALGALRAERAMRRGTPAPAAGAG